MAKTKPKAKPANNTRELDSTYFLKLVLYLILGSLWLRLRTEHMQIPIPVGFAVGLLFATHDHFQIDRKIEYAVLLVAMLIGFWAQIGLYIMY